VTYTQRKARVNGFAETEEDIEESILLILDGCIRRGEQVKTAFRKFWNNEPLTDSELDWVVIGLALGQRTKDAFDALKVAKANGGGIDDLDTATQEVLKTNYFYKISDAFAALKAVEANGGGIHDLDTATQEVLKTNYLYIQSDAYAVLEAAKANGGGVDDLDDSNLAFIEKHRKDSARGGWAHRDDGGWNDWYECLVSYKSANKHCDVPKRDKWNGKKLGQWLYDMQRAYKNFKESGSVKCSTCAMDEECFCEECFRKLEDLGVKWKVGTNAEEKKDRWEKMFNLLKEYKAKNKGDCHIKQKDTYMGEPLGKWLANQKSEEKKFRDGRKASIDSCRINRLTELGVKWAN
jgi:predicted enzyme related to lactoylglutathione lyase/predicted Fe-S protein YdhL (DUF1289 family)